jgi:hypothetical protein
VKNLNCLDVETIEKNLKNETSEENDITTGNNNENEQNKIPEIPGIIQDALNTLLVANEYLDGELAKYETYDQVNKNINLKNLIPDASNFGQLKKNGVGQTTILKFLGGNWKQWIIQDALNTSLVANEYLDGELAKYETWESLNESIKTLSASAALAMAGGLRFVDFGCGKFSTTDFSDLNNSEHRSQRTGRKKDKMRNCYFRNLNFCLRFRVCFRLVVLTDICRQSSTLSFCSFFI